MKPTHPEQPSAEVPSGGGSYVREEDGSLTRVVHPPEEPPIDTEPEPDDVVTTPDEQEA